MKVKELLIFGTFLGLSFQRVVKIISHVHILFFRCLCFNAKFAAIMDKLQLTGQNLGRVFNFRSGCVHAVHLLYYGVKLPNLKLKTRPKQLLGYLLLHIVLPATTYLQYWNRGPML
jgi:hypothetical protein